MNKSKRIYVSPENYAAIEERAKAEGKTVDQYVVELLSIFINMEPKAQ